MRTLRVNNFMIRRQHADYTMSTCLKELHEAGFENVQDCFITYDNKRNEEFEKIVSKYFPRVDNGAGTVLR